MSVDPKKFKKSFLRTLLRYVKFINIRVELHFEILIDT